MDGRSIGYGSKYSFYGSKYRFYGSKYRFYVSKYSFYGSKYRFYGSKYRFYGSIGSVDDYDMMSKALACPGRRGIIASSSVDEFREVIIIECG
jgi:hypothetical protein